MPLEIRPYEPAMAPAWNAFVAQSRNGTFLFDRGYMDYHADRFADASLVIEERGRPVGLFPANRREDRIESHAGLTYGGLVLGPDSGLAQVAAMVEAIRDHARAAGAATLLYKTVPAIYHVAPAEEDRWALARLGARLVRRDALAVIGAEPPPIPRGRRRDLDHARRSEGLRIGPSRKWEAFWSVLANRLDTRHGVRPVHNLAEMRLLAARFPDRIRLVTGEVGEEVVAGAVHYLSHRVVHCQYSAATYLGRELRAIDLVYEDGIAFARASSRVFDFGTSAEQGGRVLNEGLQRFKESFGARSVMHDIYELEC